eukprot:gene22227-28781_t
MEVDNNYNCDDQIYKQNDGDGAFLEDKLDFDDNNNDNDYDEHQQSYNNRSDDDESGESDDDSDLDRLVGGGLDEIDEERFDKYFDELEKFQATYKPVESYFNESFNLWKDYSVPIAKCMKSNMDGIQNINDNIPLYPGSKNTMKQCAVKLRNITSKHKLSVDAELDMLVFLKELLPNTANLPLHQTKNGMFKLASFSSKGHSSAEKFLFKQCLMKEIQCLDEGFAISINGQSYLIQCRLIQFVLDTKEVEHQVNVQCINAYSGCPYCFGTFGTTFDDIKNKMAISDERWRLPLFHATRHHGQTANCCPRHKSSEPFFYTNRFEYQEGKQDYNQGDCEKDDNLPQKKKEKLKQKIIPAAATELELTKPRVAQDMALQLVPYWFDVCDEANAKIIKRYLFYGNQEASLWFHDQNHYPMEMITTSEFFYYPTCNFQAFQQFRRKDRRFHQTRAASIINKRLSGYVRNKKDTVHEEGVKDHFYGFDSKYVNENHLNFDPAHAFTNCFDYLKDFWTGVSPEINADLFAHCSTTKCWSFIEEIAKQNTTEDNNNKRDNNNINKKKDKDKNNLGFPWNISNQNQTKIDSWIISLIIPVGFKDTFEVKSLFVYTKTQKFNIKMNIIKSIIPLAMFLLDREMPTEYKALFMMFSELVVDLMSPVIDSSDIASDLLHYRVIEFLVLFQGFFPPTEHHMVEVMKREDLVPLVSPLTID